MNDLQPTLQEQPWGAPALRCQHDGYQEEVLPFPCRKVRLLGILARPAAPLPSGVLIVVGGPQYRVGSHRQFVSVARALAAAGHAVLRFDLRGMGDSEGRACDFLHAAPDIAAAIDALLQAVPVLRSVVLWGLCDGASASLLYLHASADARVGGLCLINPWVRTHASLARVQLTQYYRQRLLQAGFWRRLLSGQLRARTLLAPLHQLVQLLRPPPPGPGASYPLHMAQACLAFTGPVLLVLSEHDLVAQEFAQFSASHPVWQRAWSRPGRVCRRLAGANHTFTDGAQRAQVVAWTLQDLLQPLQ